MSQNCANSQSSSPEGIRKEFLNMLFSYRPVYKPNQSDIDDFDKKKVEIIRFAQYNISKFEVDWEFIYAISSALLLQSITDDYNKSVAWEIYFEILKILLPNNIQTKTIQATSDVSAWVSWILEQKESQEALELEDSNLWKPTNPKIEINPEQASETIPQAWENDWIWYYNWVWAMLETETLGKKIPTTEQWISILESSWKDTGKLIEKLNLKMLGYYHDKLWFDLFKSIGGYNVWYYWSSSLNIRWAFCITFSSDKLFGIDTSNLKKWFPVRCLKG